MQSSSRAQKYPKVAFEVFYPVTHRLWQEVNKSNIKESTSAHALSKELEFLFVDMTS